VYLRVSFLKVYILHKDSRRQWRFTKVFSCFSSCLPCVSSCFLFESLYLTRRLTKTM